jgi:hypothetical protein
VGCMGVLLVGRRALCPTGGRRRGAHQSLLIRRHTCRPPRIYVRRCGGQGPPCLNACTPFTQSAAHPRPMAHHHDISMTCQPVPDGAMTGRTSDHSLSVSSGGGLGSSPRCWAKVSFAPCSPTTWCTSVRRCVRACVRACLHALHSAANRAGGAGPASAEPPSPHVALCVLGCSPGMVQGSPADTMAMRWGLLACAAGGRAGLAGLPEPHAGGGTLVTRCARHTPPSLRP